MGDCSTLFLGVMESENYFVVPIGSNTPVSSLGTVLHFEPVGPEAALPWSVVLHL